MYTYTHNEILVVTNNEVLPFATMLTDLKSIMLSEVGQRKTNAECYLKI